VHRRLTEELGMKGVEFFFDRKGEPKAVLIDLRKHASIWEDFRDLLVANERRNEPRESLEEVKTMLHRKRKPLAKT
jgi:hypothetical protein